MSSLNVASIASHLGVFTDYFAVFGAVVCGLLTLKASKTVLSYSIRAVRRSFAIDPKTYGRWAVITGCTDGIGKSYALQLAEKGMDVVLISRSPAKLSAVAAEIEKRYKCQVKVIVADFKRTDIYDNIKQQLQGLDVGVLVNNVGMLHPSSPAYHLDMQDLEQHCKDIINVNVLSCVMMTGVVLPSMLEKKRGTIINIASGAGLRPLPFFALYSATKGFMAYLTKALELEYSSHGVFFQLIAPNQVETNMTRGISKAKEMQESFFFPSAHTFVNCALKTIGRETTSGPYWPHELQQIFTAGLSDSLLTPLLMNERNKMADYLKKM